MADAKKEVPKPELFKNQALTSDIEAERQTSHPTPDGGAAGAAAAPSKEDTEQEPGDIDVVALRDGFYDNVRREPGHKFQIRDENELGSWMALADSKKEEARRKKEAKMKKEARKRDLEKKMKDLDADEE